MIKRIFFLGLTAPTLLLILWLIVGLAYELTFLRCQCIKDYDGIEYKKVHDGQRLMIVENVDTFRFNMGGCHGNSVFWVNGHYFDSIGALLHEQIMSFDTLTKKLERHESIDDLKEHIGVNDIEFENP